MAVTLTVTVNFNVGINFDATLELIKWTRKNKITATSISKNSPAITIKTLVFLRLIFVTNLPEGGYHPFELEIDTPKV